ncbi:MAG TPA: cell division protein ZipA [Gammaproteobacteria bacterium]|nr:cell division protein ZipA [Gammaproteobacteria bacterium]
MENLRWILLFSGLVLLVLVYLMSRGKKQKKRLEKRQEEDARLDPLFDNIAVSEESSKSEPVFPAEEELNFELDMQSMPDARQKKSRPALSEDDQKTTVVSNLVHGHEKVNQILAEKIDADEVPDEGVQETAQMDIGDLLDVDSFAGDEATETHEPQRAVEKVISLNVKAAEGGSFKGQDLLRIFKEREYEFGEMDIFHSRYQGKVVFSIINLVEPGWFDPDTMDGFLTPGIALFMQLPGPLSADVALDVMLSEARVLSEDLGGEVYDAAHQRLTDKVVGKLHASVAEYMEHAQ